MKSRHIEYASARGTMYVTIGITDGTPWWVESDFAARGHIAGHPTWLSEAATSIGQSVYTGASVAFHILSLGLDTAEFVDEQLGPVYWAAIADDIEAERAIRMAVSRAD